MFALFTNCQFKTQYGNGNRKSAFCNLSFSSLSTNPVSYPWLILNQAASIISFFLICVSCFNGKWENFGLYSGSFKDKAVEAGSHKYCAQQQNDFVFFQNQWLIDTSFAGSAFVQIRQKLVINRSTSDWSDPDSWKPFTIKQLLMRLINLSPFKPPSLLCGSKCAHHAILCVSMRACGLHQ